MAKGADKFLQKRVKDLLDPRQAARRVAAVDGYLLAVECLHESGGLFSTFTFERVEGGAGDPLEAVRQHINPGYRIHLLPIEWQKELAATLPNAVFGETSLRPVVRQRVVDTLIVLLNRATSDATSAWRVETDPGKDFYHCYWLTYLFHTPHGLFLLHFATDD